MPDFFSFYDKQGPVRQASIGGFGDTPIETPQRLIDGAVWLDRGKTGDAAQVDGWYSLSPDQKWVKAADAVELPFGEKTILPGTESGAKIETYRRKGDGAVFMHPKFFGGGAVQGVSEPGWYVEQGGKLVKADAEQSWLRTAKGAVSQGMGAVGSYLKENASAELATAKESIAKEGEPFSYGYDATKRLVQGAGTKVLDFGQGAVALYNKGMGSLAGDATQKRMGAMQMRDHFIPGEITKERAADEKQLDEMAQVNHKLDTDLRMFGRRGELVRGEDGNLVALTPLAQAALDHFNDLQPKMQAVQRRVEQAGYAEQGLNESMKGAGNLGADVLDVVGQVALMEMSGGLAAGAKAGKAASMGVKTAATLEKLGIPADIAAKAGRFLTKEIPSVLEAAASSGAKTLEAGGKAGKLTGLAQKIAATSANEGAGAVKRGLAHAGQGLAMGAPGAVQEFAQLYGGEENRTALSALWETILSQPKAAAVMVPMLSHRLRGATMRWDKTSLKGAALNTLARTGTLAGTSTLADLLASGGDATAVGNFPAHVKGLLGLELWGGARGLSGARDAAMKAADAKAVSKDAHINALKELAQDSTALKAIEKQLEEVRKTGTPEEISQGEDVVSTLKAQIAEHKATAAAHAENLARTDEAAKGLGIKPEKLEERAKQIQGQITEAKPKAKIADPAEGMLGKAKPAAEKTEHFASTASAQEAQVRTLTAELNQAIAEGKPKEDVAALREQIDAVKEDAALRREVAQKRTTAAERFLKSEDVFDETDAERGTRWSHVSDNEAKRIHEMYGMGDPANRTAKNVKAYQKAMDVAQDLGQRYPMGSGPTEKPALGGISAPQGKPKPAAEPVEPPAKPISKPVDYREGINESLDHPGVRAGGTWKSMRGLANNLLDKVRTGRRDAAAEILLRRKANGSALDPVAERLITEAKGDFQALSDALERQPKLVEKWGTDHGQERAQRDGAALDAINRAMTEQDLAKSGTDVHTALRHVYELEQAKIEKYRASGKEIGSPLLEAFPTFGELEKHVHGLTDGLRQGVGEARRQAPKVADAIERHVEGKRKFTQAAMEGADPASAEGFQAQAKVLADQLERVHGIKAKLQEDPNAVDGLGGLYGAATESWLEQVKLGHQNNQDRTVYAPTGGKLDGYKATFNSERGIYTVKPAGGGTELFRPQEMGSLTGKIAYTPEQLRALWAADHEPGVPFGARDARGVTIPGHNWNWTNPHDKTDLNPDRLFPQPRPAAHTKEMVLAGEEGATRSTQHTVDHFDMGRFMREADAILKNRLGDAGKVDWKAASKDFVPKVKPEPTPEEIQEADARARYRNLVEQRGHEFDHEQVVQARLAQPTDPQPLAPELATEIQAEIRKWGGAAVNMDRDALLGRLKAAGATTTQLEQDGKAKADPKHTVLSARELQAVLNLWERPEVAQSTAQAFQGGSRRQGVGSDLGRDAGAFEDRRDTVDQAAEQRRQNEESRFAKGRGDEVHRDTAGAAFGAARQDRAIAARALEKLASSGILTEKDFLLPGASPHEQSLSDAGNLLTHRNAGMRRGLETALGEAVESLGGTEEVSALAERLRLDFTEHRERDRGVTDGLLKKWGGKWVPNQANVEADRIFNRFMAARELPAEGDPARQDHLDALGQNPHLRASMTRMMVREQLLKMASDLRTMNDPEETAGHLAAREQLGAYLETAAEKAAHAGDQALFDHITATSGSYFKPILEPTQTGEQAPGKARTTLTPEDMVALTNKDHWRHQEMLDVFKGDTDPWGHTKDHSSPDASPLERILSPHLEEPTANLDPAKLTSRLLDDANTAIGRLNTRAKVEETLDRWSAPGASPFLKARADQWYENRHQIERLTTGIEAKSKSQILQITDRMDPTLFSALKIQEGFRDVRGSFNAATQVLELHNGFKRAVEQGWSSQSTGTFFHEMGHFLTTYMDPAFRGRVLNRYQNHMEEVTKRDPIMKAIFGEGSPIDWMTLGESSIEGAGRERNITVSPEERLQIIDRLKGTASADIMRRLGDTLPAGAEQGEHVERLVNKLFRPAEDGRFQIDLRNITTASSDFKRFYRFLNPDEYFSETLGNFVMMASAGKVSAHHQERFDDLVGHGSDRVETLSDMLSMVKTMAAMRGVDRPTGGGRLDLMADAVSMLKNSASSGVSLGTPMARPITPGKALTPASHQMLEEDVTGPGPTARQANAIRDGLKMADDRLYRAAEYAGGAIKGITRKAVEIMAADAVSPGSRSFSHLHTWMDARYGAARAADEKAANSARVAVDAAFRRENSTTWFDAAQHLVDSGKAIEQAVANHQGIKLFKGKIGEKEVFINTDAEGKVVQAMSPAQLDAVRFVESNGKRGGELLSPELRSTLSAWIGSPEAPGAKHELEAWRRDEMMKAPGVDKDLAEKMWIKDYLAHLYPAKGSGRSMDRILEERDSIASLDRFQSRIYNTYDEALARGGLLPRLANPIETYLLGAREGSRVIQLRNTIGHLEARGLASWGYSDQNPGFVRLELGPKGSTAMKRLGFHQAEPLKVGDEPVQMPSKDIWIHPELEPLMRSAFDYGISKTVFGGVFRGAMMVNHILSPAKLALSGFHLGMISKLGGVEAMRSTWGNYRRLRAQGVTQDEAMRRSFESTAGQAFALGALGEGKRVRDLFMEHGRKNLQEIGELEGISDLDKATLVMMQAGGYAPMHSATRETMEREQLAQAFSEGAWGKTMWKGYTGGMEMVQDALMNHTVAPIKTGHLALDFQRKLKTTYGEKLDFGKFTQDLFGSQQKEGQPYATSELGEYARQMTSHADNVFGMTNYRKLMINPILKDLMHAWNLSFGWRHGTMSIVFKAADETLNNAPLVGRAFRGLKKGAGGTGIQGPVEGRENIRFMATHGAMDALMTMVLGAVGIAQFPNWRGKKDEEGNPIAEDLDWAAFRGRLEDLVLPVLSDRLNHNSLPNRYATGYAYDFWSALKNPAKWIAGHTEGNSPLITTGGAMITGKDGIGNEIGNPYNLPMPREWAQNISNWMTDPESSAFLVGAAKRGLQVPQEFVPISATTFKRQLDDGENPIVAALTLAGLRKVPDFKAFGQTPLVREAMDRLSAGSGGKSKDSEKQQVKVERDKATAAAINQKDASLLGPLVEKGMKPGGVTRLTNTVFRSTGEPGGDQPRTAAERLFMGAKFEDRLALMQLARGDEGRLLWPIFAAGAQKGIEDQYAISEAKGDAALRKFEALQKKWGE